jgi:hypothetical protein
LRYNEWAKEIETLGLKARSLLVDEEVLTESVKIGEDTFKIFLGDRVRYSINGCKSDYFRREYQAKEPKWQVLLGGLKSKVAMAETLNTKLLDAMVAPYMKEAVMERLTGAETDIQDNETILRKCVAKRLEKLNKTIPEVYLGVEFKIKSPSENYDLGIHYSWHTAAVRYGAVESANLAAISKVGIKNCWSFLCNFEQITLRVNEFSVIMKQLVKILDKED